MKKLLLAAVLLCLAFGGWMLATDRGVGDVVDAVTGGSDTARVLADADRGDAAAQFRAASLLLVPENARRAGIEPNPPAGIGWLSKAAVGGDNRARFAIALRHITGDRVPQDNEAAGRLFLDMAEDGIAPAQAIVGDMFERGWTVPASDDMALRFYRQAAKGGSVQARARLSRLLTQNRVPRARQAEIAALADNPSRAGELATLFQIAMTQRYLSAGDSGLARQREQTLQGFAVFADSLRPAAADAGFDLPLIAEAQTGIFMTDAERLAWRIVLERHDPQIETGGADALAAGMTPEQISAANALADRTTAKWKTR